MRTVLICHANAPVVREGMANWLRSFSDLAGIVVLEEAGQRRWKRVRREIRRTGLLRFLDVAAFRLHYRLNYAAADAAWTSEQLAMMAAKYGAAESPENEIIASSPNTKAVREFLSEADPDIIIAGCKQILGKKTFEIAKSGTFVLHPGVCPDYRNAHGGFWALAKNDPENVGMSLVKIDAGIDTGPVYGHFRQPFDGATESHLRIQRRQTLDSLDDVAGVLEDVVAGMADPLDVSQRPSAEYGQPWLSAYYRWKLGLAGRASRSEGTVTLGKAVADHPSHTADNELLSV